ncbi:MAG: phospholipase D family protein [Nitrospirae bacterium]|nr:phospholipase D family protein [Nitrospirota bacterium]
MIQSPLPYVRMRSCAGLLFWLVVSVLCGPKWEVSAASVEVWYSPEDEPLKRVVQIYEHATRYIFVAVYGLTSPLAVRALVEAKKRGVDVRVISDRERLDDAKQRMALSVLQEARIPIKVNRHDGLMHLKQVVVDDEVNTNGSMNHTTSGNRYNDERLDVIRDHALAARARVKFLTMWNDEERFGPWKE